VYIFLYLSEEQCSTTKENLIGRNYEWAQMKEDNQRAGDRHCTMCIVYTNLNNFFSQFCIFSLKLKCWFYLIGLYVLEYTLFNPLFH